MGNSHNLRAKNIKFYFNPISLKIEPIGYDFHVGIRYLKRLVGENRIVLGKNKKIIWDEQLFNDKDLYSSYVRYLNKFSRQEYLDEFFDQVKEEYNKRLHLIYSENPLYLDNSFKTLSENQLYIRRKLSPKTITRTFLQDYNE